MAAQQMNMEWGSSMDVDQPMEVDQSDSEMSNAWRRPEGEQSEYWPEATDDEDFRGRQSWADFGSQSRDSSARSNQSSGREQRPVRPRLAWAVAELENPAVVGAGDDEPDLQEWSTATLLRA